MSFEDNAISARKASNSAEGRRFHAKFYSGAKGACGNLKGDYIATNWFPCGTKLEVTYKNKMRVGVVLDRMGAWPDKGCHCLDLSESLFKKFADLSVGEIEVRAQSRQEARSDRNSVSKNTRSVTNLPDEAKQCKRCFTDYSFLVGNEVFNGAANQNIIDNIPPALSPHYIEGQPYRYGGVGMGGKSSIPVQYTCDTDCVITWKQGDAWDDGFGNGAFGQIVY